MTRSSCNIQISAGKNSKNVGELFSKTDITNDVEKFY